MLYARSDTDSPEILTGEREIMKRIPWAVAVFLVVCCSAASQMQNGGVIATNSKSRPPHLEKTLKPSNESLIDALVAAPTLYVMYVEDGAADASVLALYPDLDGKATNPIAKEVKDIVSLRDKAIPLLIEHLDDTRPTAATISGGGYLTDKPIRVPVGHICLDILIHLAGTKAPIYDKQDHHGFQGLVQDGFYFRPDDYTMLGDQFVERAIVRITKANWERVYRAGKIKYDYVVTWK
jgi:hypothetical protein